MITKIDVTRDVQGSFFAVGDWKSKHEELKVVLQRLKKSFFHDNGNSLSTCF